MQGYSRPDRKRFRYVAEQLPVPPPLGCSLTEHEWGRSATREEVAGHTTAYLRAQLLPVSRYPKISSSMLVPVLIVPFRLPVILDSPMRPR